MRSCLATAPLLLCLAACHPPDQDPWEGWIYPTGSLTTSVTLGTFPTYEACRYEAKARLRDLNATEVGQFECGSYCRTPKGMTIKSCQETRDD